MTYKELQEKWGYKAANVIYLYSADTGEELDITESEAETFQVTGVHFSGGVLSVELLCEHEENMV